MDVAYPDVTSNLTKSKSYKETHVFKLKYKLADNKVAKGETGTRLQCTRGIQILIQPQFLSLSTGKRTNRAVCKVYTFMYL